MINQFYLSTAGFCICLLLLVNIKKNTNKVNIFLILFLLLINVFNFLIYATMFTNNKYLVAFASIHFSPLVVLTGPMLFFYVRGLFNDDAKLTKKDALHFIPSILYFINNFNYYLFPIEKKLAFAEKIILDRSMLLYFEPVLFSGYIAQLFRSISAITYIGICVMVIYKNAKKHYENKNQFSLILRWLFVLLVFNLIMNIGVLYNVARLLLSWNFHASITITPWVTYFITLLSLIVMNLGIFFFPNILYGLPKLYDSLPNKSSIPDVTNSNSGIETDLHSSDKYYSIQAQLDEYFSAKPYLHDGFSLQVMSKEMGIPQHHLSFYFTEELNTSFNDWKINFQINHILDLTNKSIEHNQKENFNSKQYYFINNPAFVQAFKLKTGKCIAEYLQTN